MSADFESKVVARDVLRERLADLARPLVFTNGVFDVLHRGHVTYLAQARSYGGSLVVGVNSDASVRGLDKGSDRPINTAADRAALLAALASVDLVTVFDEDTPYELIAAIRPDVIIKGGDYDMDRLAESALVRGWGGTALAIPFVHQRSTSALLRKIRTSGR